MNRIHRLVWSHLRNAWVVAHEHATARGKAPATRRLGRPAALLLAALSGATAQANPVGPQVVHGSAAIQQGGSTLTVTNSANAIINWQSFSIAQNETTRFIQPSVSSAVLNRVLGGDPSQLLGQLHSNGKVFLVNPAGILVGPGARIDVGSLVASTLHLSNEDFLANRLNFIGDAGTGSVVNQGAISTPAGGSVYLIGAQVTNEGQVTTPGGDTVLAAGQRVQMGELGAPGLKVEISGTDNAAANLGRIVADAGRIGVIGALVKNSGTLDTSSVVNEGGRIFLRATKQIALTETSRIAADGQIGGSIVAKVEKDGSLAGELVARGELSAQGGGTTASGGFVETSAAKVKIADGFRATTKGGEWLIDPNDFRVAADGDISGATLSTNLGGGNVTILSSSGGTAGGGDIHVNEAVSWSANRLTLTAARDININAVMTASGNSTLTMSTATANGGDSAVAGGTVKVGFNADGSFKGRVDFPGRSGTGFLTINGSGYTVINSLGAAADATSGTSQTLQGIGRSGNLAGKFALGSDITNGGDTATWNGNQGFAPIGANVAGGQFAGDFNGLGHVISGLTINRSGTTNVGLFGVFTSSSSPLISNVGLSGGSIVGGSATGGLVGWNNTGSIYNSYVTATVNGTSMVGGLVGWHTSVGTISNSHATGNVGSTNFAGAIGGLVGESRGTITHSYATGNISGTTHVGGLVGNNTVEGDIFNSYATGSVSGTDSSAYVGGLVGRNGEATTGRQCEIVNSYATGSVSGFGSNVGGLVGRAETSSTIIDSFAAGTVTGGGLVGYNTGVITRSYWDKDSSGRTTSAGGTGLTGVQMRAAASFSGWDFTNTWAIDEGSSYPYLRANRPVLHPGIAYVTWDGGAGTLNWWDANNWSGNAVPATGDSVYVDIAGSNTLLYSALAGTRSIAALINNEGFSLSGGSFTIGGSATFKDALSISGGTLNLNNAATANSLTLAGGTLGGSGVLTVAGTANVSANSTLATTVDLGGRALSVGAQLNLATGAAIRNAAIAGTAGLWLNANSGATLDGVTLNAPMTQDYGSTLTIAHGLTLNNTLTLQGYCCNTSTINFSGVGEQTLSGTGTIHNNGDTYAVIQPTGTAALTIGSGITLRNTRRDMQVGAAGLGLSNHGTLQADGWTLTVTGNNWTNDGTLRANGGTLATTGSWSNTGSLISAAGSLNLGGNWSTSTPVALSGGTLNVGGSWSDATLKVNQSGGTLSLNSNFSTAQLAGIERSAGGVQVSGAAWDNTNASYDFSAAGHLGQVNLINGASIKGGTLSGSQGLWLNANHGATLDGVTLNAPLTQDYGSTLTIAHGLTLNNTLTLQGYCCNTSTINFSGVGEQTLSGTGTIHNNGDTYAVIQPTGTAALTIGSGITIRNTRRDMQVGAAGLGLTNHGALQSDGWTLTVTGSNWTNDGTLKANGGTLTTAGNWSNTGTLSSVAGTFNLGGNWSTTTPVALTGGTLNVGGSWSDATLKIAQSGGTLSLNSNFSTAQLAGIERSAGSVQLSGAAWDNTNASYDFSAAGHLGQVNLINGASIKGGTLSGSVGLWLNANSGATLDGVTLNAPLTQDYGSTLTIANGLILNNTLTLQGYCCTTSTINFSGVGEQTLSGTGTIHNNGDTYAVIQPTGTAALAIGSGITIRNTRRDMQVGAAGLGLSNHGTLQSDGWTLTVTGNNWSNDGTLKANGGTLATAGTWTNTGTLSSVAGSFNLGGNWSTTTPVALTGGTLNVGGAWSDATLKIAQSGGTLSLNSNFSTSQLAGIERSAGGVQLSGAAWDNSNAGYDFSAAGHLGQVNLANGASIKGGTLSGSVGLWLNANSGATLDGVTLNAPLTQDYGSTLTIANGLILNNTLTLQGYCCSTSTINFSGTGEQTLAGSGTIHNNGDTYAVIQPTGTAALAIGSGITIRNSRRDMQIGAAGLGLSNHGTLQSDGWTLTVTGSNWSNDGTLNANGGTLTTAGTWSNTGLLTASAGTLNIGSLGTNAGTIQTGAGTITTANANLINSGTISGSGTLTLGSGTLTNGGLLAPGSAAGDTTGTLTIAGNLLLAAGGRLDIDVNSPLAGDYDKLAVTGTASLTDGTLNLAGYGGAASYAILSAANGLGGSSFATTTHGTLTQTPAYAANGLTLAVTANSSTTISWDGGAGTANWSDAQNWSNDLVPSAASRLYIGSGAGSVAVSGGALAAYAINADGGLNLGGGSLALSGDSAFRGTMNLSGGSLTLSGTTTFGGSTNVSGSTLGGSGALVVPAGGTLNWSGGSIAASGAATLSTQAGATANVSGGTLGTGRTWTNNGTLNLTATDWHNAGELRHAGGVLTLGGATTPAGLGSFSRSGGSVNLSGTLYLGGATLDIGSSGLFGSGGLDSFSGTIAGGTLVSGDGRALKTAGGTLDGVTVGSNLAIGTGTLNIANGLTLANGSTLRNDGGTWYLNGSGSQAIGPTTGSATIELRGGTLRANGSTQSITLASGLTVKGWGAVDNSGSQGWINHGTVDASVDGQTLSITPSAFSNDGTVKTSAGKLTLSPGSLTNAGAITVAGGALTAAPTSLVNTASGTISVAAGAIATLSPAMLANAGSITSNGVSLGITPSSTWSNSGTITVNSGTLNLAGSFGAADLANGHFGSAAGSHVNMAGGTLYLGGATLDIGSGGLFGAGGLDGFAGTIAGGTLQSGDGRLLKTAGGTLDGVTIGSNLATGTGTLNIANGLTLANGTTLRNDGGTWYLNGSGSQSIGTATGSATIELSGGTLRANGSTQIVALGSGLTVKGWGSLDNSGSQGWINHGTVEASVDGQTLSITPSSFSNTGTVKTTAGKLTLSPGSLTNAGAITVAAGGALTAAPTSLVNSATGTITVAAGATATLSPATLANAGSITSNGASLSITPSSTWSNSGTITVNSGTLNLAGSFGAADLANGHLSSAVGTRVNLAGGTLYLNGATLDIGSGGLFGSAGLDGFSGTIAGGTLQSGDGRALKTAGGTLDGVTIGGNLATGTGTLNIANGLTLANGVTLRNDGGTWYLNGSGSQSIGTATGSAAIELSGGTLRANGGSQTIALASGLTVKGWGSLDNSGSQGWINRGTIEASVDGQTLSITPSAFTNDGTVKSAAGKLSVGASSFTNNAVIASGAGAVTLGGGTLTNNGLAETLGSGSITVSSGNATNNGTLRATLGALNFAGTTFTNSGSVDYAAGSAGTISAGTFNNAGSLAFGGSLLTLSGGSLNNSGTLDISAGTANVGGTGFSHTGTLQLASGAAMNVSSTTTTLGGGTLRGSGAATPVLTISGALAMSGPLLIDHLNLSKSGATAATQGALPNGAAASIHLKNGAVINNSSAWTMNLAVFTLDDAGAAAFNNNAGGTLSVPATGRAIFGPGVVLNNAGTVNASGALTTATLANATGATLDITGSTQAQNIINDGILKVEGGTGTVSGDVINNGAFSVKSGTAAIYGSLLNAASGSIALDNGTLNVLGGTIDNGSLILAAASENTLAGNYAKSTGLTLGSGILNIAGAYSGTAGSSVTLSGGTLAIGAGACLSTPALALDGGTVNGGGNLKVADSFSQTAGTLGNGFATVDIAQDSGVLAIGSLGATGAVNLTATAGAISGGAITTPGLLTTRSASGTTLNAANAVGSFNGRNTTSGAIALTNTAATLTITGLAQAGAGGVSIANTGNLATSGALTVAATAPGNMTLAATGGITIGSAISATGAGGALNLELNAASGSSTGNTISLNGGTLTLSGGNLTLSNGAMLANAAVASPAGKRLWLNANSGATFDGVTLDAPMTQDYGATLTIAHGLTLNDTLTLQGYCCTTSTINFSGAGEQMLSGTGTIHNNGDTYALIQPTGTAALTIGSGITIKNSRRDMQVGAAGLGLTNHGSLQSDGWTLTVTGSNWANNGTLKANGGTLTTAGTWSNTGTLSSAAGTFNLGGNWSTSTPVALSGGTLNVGGSWSDATLKVNQSGGTLSLNSNFSTAQLAGIERSAGGVQVSGAAWDNSNSTYDFSAAGHLGQVNLTNGASIKGGTLSGSVGLWLNANHGATLDGVTLNAPLTQDYGSTLTIAHGLTLNDTLTLQGYCCTTSSINFSGVGEQTLSGSGTIHNNGDTYALIQPTGTAALTIGSGITIKNSRRDMQVGAAGLGLTNQGTLQADGWTLTVTGSKWSNDGTLKANGGTLTTAGNWSNTGTLAAAAGTFNLGGNWSTTTPVALTGGTLNVGGSWSDATLKIAQSGGTLSVNSNFSTAQLAGIERSAGGVQVSGAAWDNTSASYDFSAAGHLGQVNLTNGASIKGGTLSGSVGLWLNANQGATLDGVTLNAPMTQDYGSTLTIANGLTLNDTLTMQGGCCTTSSINFSGVGEQTLSGTGTIHNNGDTYAVIQPTGTAALTIGSGITLRNSRRDMQVGAAGLGLTNHGTLQSDGWTLTVTGKDWTNDGTLKANGGTLTTAGNWSNTGTLAAAAGTFNLGGSWSTTTPVALTGGTLNVGGSWSDATLKVNQSGGTLSLNSNFSTAQLAGIERSAGGVQLSGAAWDNSNSTYDFSAAGHLGQVNLINGASIKGGTLSGSQGLWLNANHGATLDGVTLDAPMIQDYGSTLTIAHGLTLNSTLTMQGGCCSTSSINFSGVGEQTLAGTGTIHNNGDTYALIQPTGTAALTIGSGITIKNNRRDMQVGAAGLGLTNHGTLQSDGWTLTVTGNNWSNDGTLKANGGTLTSAGTWTNTGLLTASAGTLNIGSLGTNAGTIQTGAGTLTTANANLINEGTIAGSGTLTLGSGTLTNNGTLSPAGRGTIGTLTIAGHLIQNGTGSVEADIGQVAGTQYDRLAVTGSATFAGGNAGTLKVNRVYPYNQNTGENYPVMSWGSYSGNFAAVAQDASVIVNPVYSAGAVNLNVASFSAIDAWAVDASGDWGVGGNWTLGRAPQSGEIVIIDRPAGSYTVTVSSGSQLSTHLRAEEALAITGGSLTLSGIASVNGGLDLAGGTLSVPGTATVAGALNVSAGSVGGSGTLIATTLAKTGAATVAIAPVFNNTGSTTVSGGRLNFAGNGTHSGAFSVADGATLGFIGGSHAFNAGSDVSGAGSVVFDGATSSINAGYSIAATGTTTVAHGATSFNVPLSFAKAFSFGAGETDSLGGSGNLTFNGAFNWNGGSDVIGSGTLTTYGVTTISTPDGVLGAGLGKHWTNHGTVNIASGAADYYNALHFYNVAGLTLTNAASGVINLGGNRSLAIATWNQSGHSLINYGTINKPAGGLAVQTIGDGGLAFHNRGSVNIAGGTLNIAGGGSDTGRYDVAGGALLGFTGGTRSLDAGSDISGAGGVKVSAGTVNINAGYGIAASGTTTINGSGTLNFNVPLAFANSFTLADVSARLGGSGNLVMNGSFNWSGNADVVGSGTLTTVGTTTISGTGNYMARHWTNAAGGHVILAAGNSDFELPAGSVFDNAGVVDVNSTKANPIASLWGGTAAVNNTGTLNWNGNGAIDAPVQVNNSGTLNVAGALTLAGGFTVAAAGRIELAAGATLKKSGGFTNDGLIAGAGTIDVGAGNTLANAGTLAPGSASGDRTGTLSVAGNYSQASGGTLAVELGGAGAGQYDKLAVSGNVTLAGTLNATLVDGYTPAGQSIDVIAAGGAAAGSFAVATAPTGINGALIGGNLYRLTHSAMNCAGACWDGGGGADYSWTNVANWTGDTLPGSGDTVWLNLVDGVTVNLANSSQTIRALNSDANNHLVIGSGGALTLNDAAATSTLAGNLTLSGGTLTANGALNLASLTLGSGTLAGTGHVAVAGAFNWSGGMLDGAGTFSTSGTTTLSGSGEKMLRDRAWTNSGTVALTAGRLTFFETGASGSPALTNQSAGSVTMASTTTGDPIAGVNGGSFNNAGTLNWNAAYADYGYSNIGVAFNNTGTANVNDNLRLMKNGTHTGRFNVATGKTLTLAAGTHDLNAGAGIEGAGTLAVVGATVNVNTPVTVVNLKLSGVGSAINDAAGMNVSGAFDWSGGTIRGAGTLHTSGTATLSASNVKTLQDTTWTNAGTVSLTDGYLTFADTETAGAPVFTNQADGIVTTTSTYYTGPFYATSGASGPSGTFNNAGTLNWNAAHPSYGSAIYPAFNNSGTFNVNASVSVVGGGTDTGRYNVAGGKTLGFTGTRTLDAGAVVAGTGSLQLNGALTLRGGTVNGDGGLGIATTSGTALDMGGGTLNFNNAAVVGSLVLSGGTIGGAGALTVTDSFSRSGGTLANTLTGLAVTQAAGDLAPGDLNIDGPIVLNAPNGRITLGAMVTSGRWLVYAANPASVTKNGLASNFRQYNTNYGGAVAGSGNGFIYASAPGTLSVATALATGKAAHVYGDAPDAGFGYTLSGFADAEDNVANIGLTGTAAYSGAPSAASNAGSYSVTYANGLGSSAGYTFAAGTPLAYSVTPATLTLTADDKSRVYGEANPAFGYSASGFKLGDTAAVIGAAPSLATAATASSGVGQVAIGVSGGDAGGNYTLAYAPGTLSITPRALFVSAEAQSKIYGDADPALTYRVGATAAGTGLVNGDSLAGSLVRAPGETVAGGPYAIGQGSLSAGNNYTLAYVPGQLAITPRALIVSADAQSKTYHDADPQLSYRVGATAAGTGLVNGDSLAGSLARAPGETVAGGPYAIGQGSLAAGANYSLSFTGNHLAITPLASVAWTGGESGLWSVASNWAGGALPDGINVLAVTIPAGAAVSFDSAVAATTLNSLSSEGALIMAGSELTINQQLVTPQFSQSGGSLVGTGNFTVTQGFSQSGGSIALTGAAQAAITQASGDLVVAKLTAPTASLTAGAGAIGQSGALIVGALSTHSSAGTTLTDVGNRIGSFSASNSGSGTLSLRNSGTLVLPELANAGGDIDVDNIGAVSTVGAIGAPQGRVALAAHSPLTIGSGGIDAGKGVTLTAGAGAGVLTLGGAVRSAAGTVALTGDSVAQNADIDAGSGSVAVTARSGDIVLAATAQTTGATIAYAAPSGAVAGKIEQFVGATSFDSPSAPASDPCVLNPAAAGCVAEVVAQAAPQLQNQQQQLAAVTETLTGKSAAEEAPLTGRPVDAGSGAAAVAAAIAPPSAAAAATQPARTLADGTIGGGAGQFGSDTALAAAAPVATPAPAADAGNGFAATPAAPAAESQAPGGAAGKSDGGASSATPAASAEGNGAAAKGEEKSDGKSKERAKKAEAKDDKSAAPAKSKPRRAGTCT